MNINFPIDSIDGAILIDRDTKLFRILHKPSGRFICKYTRNQKKYFWDSVRSAKAAITSILHKSYFYSKLLKGEADRLGYNQYDEAFEKLAKEEFHRMFEIIPVGDL